MFKDLLQYFLYVSFRMVTSLVYYGVSFASSDLSGNFHRDYILSSLVEFPAAVLAVLAST